MSKFNEELIRELMSEGASTKEAEDLANVAESLALLRDEKPSIQAKPSLSAALKAGVGGLVLALAVVGLLIVSLGSLPGEPLHPIKSFSEAVAVKLDPALAPTVMMDKSWEVAQLTSQHKPTREVVVALNSYNYAFSEAQGRDYSAAWEYCKAELTQARDDSNGTIRQELNHSIAAIPDAS
jgi:hypothetical protein